MDRNMNRPHWYNRQGSGGGGLKGGRPPRLTPSEPSHSHPHQSAAHSPSSGVPPPSTTPPAHTTPHDDLVNYIYESWDKISREAQVFEPPRHLPQRPPLPILDLNSWFGRRNPHTQHSQHTHTIKHNS